MPQTWDFWAIRHKTTQEWFPAVGQITPALYTSQAAAVSVAKPFDGDLLWDVVPVTITMTEI